MGNIKLNSLEKRWVLYDIGNSAFTLLVSTILPIYFASLTDAAGISETDSLAYWGYATSLVTIIVAFMGPILGTIADFKGMKKPIFLASVIIGAVACLLMGAPLPWILFLVFFVIAKIGYSASLVFNDAMLPDVTTNDRMDMVSSFGYAWGYIGSCIPFILSIVVVMFLGLPIGIGMMIALIINAVWWIAFTVPLLKSYKQIHYVERQPKMIVASFKRLGKALTSIKSEKGIFLFLLAFFFYIDGVYTIIDMATTFGTALGFGATTLLLALLVTQIVAFPCAIIFGRIAAKVNNDKLIKICIVAYACIAIYALQLDQAWEFWVLAVCVGMFQGGIQALSRSYFAKIIPADKAGEYFGIYDIFGKGAAFFGVLLVSITTQLTESPNYGVASIAILFVAGFITFHFAAKENRRVQAERSLTDNSQE
ncbi:MAG: MFS transporter [Clostridia bacterium]